MSRYRKVEVKTYGDEKFRRLTPLLPSGQALWLYLITGPHTTAIPGLFRAGRAGLAEEMGWTQEAFDKAFAEVFAEGMAKADWTHRVVWLPNSLKHNKPASPNVVKFWVAELELIPECELKREAVQRLEHGLSELHPSFLAALSVRHNPSPKEERKPLAKASAIALPNQQQQQQQQQHEEKTLALTASAVPAGPPFLTLPLNDGSEYAITEGRADEWQSLYQAVDVRQELRKYKGWANSNPTKRKTRRGILTSVNTWLAKSHDNSTTHRKGENSGANRAQRRTDSNIEAAKRALESLTDNGSGVPG